MYLGGTKLGGTKRRWYKKPGICFKTLKEFINDLEQRFRGSDLILENKTIAINLTIDVRLYLRKPTLNECMQIFFRVFSTRHMRLAYLH